MSEDTRAGDERRSDSTTPHFQRAYDWSTTSPSIAAVTALATVIGVEPTKLDSTLHEYVDPEALDALVRHRQSERVTVSFATDRYRIWFDGDELSVRSHDR
ncbi:HalOD1 output domain-containing protein [Natronococcus sp.]|uniref:HalOD1 output domain-containing protein n=1 Tax=Natronococcus sp. TaxID=35747 RepID=UPI003A4D88B7